MYQKIRQTREQHHSERLGKFSKTGKIRVTFKDRLDGEYRAHALWQEL